MIRRKECLAIYETLTKDPTSMFWESWEKRERKGQKHYLKKLWTM